MKKSIYSVLTAFLIAVLTVSPAFAAKISGSMGLGSIKFTGWAAGFSKDPVTFTLYAKGIPDVTCYDPGNKKDPVPGQNPVSVSTLTSAQFDVPIDENGKFDVNLEASVDATAFSAKQLGCPNNNWRAVVTFVYWNYASLTVTDDVTHEVVYFNESACTTTHNPDSISCPGFE